MPSSVPGSLVVKEKGITDGLLRSFHAVSRAGWIDCNLVVSRDGLWESSFIFFKGIGLEEMKREKRQTLEAIGLDSREVLLLLILMQKLMIIQVNAVKPGWLQKKDVLVSNETAMIWNSYYNTHFVVPNKRQLPNFSLIFRYLMTICQASFFWYCFDIFSCLTNYLLTLWCILLLFQVRVKSFNNYCTMFFFQNNLEKAEIKIFTWCVIFHNILRLLLDREFTENTCIWIRYPHSS